jgi:hypothetical protein
MNKNKKSFPKGSMCGACLHRERDCSHLPFTAYPVIKVYRDGTKAVKCAGFEKLRTTANKKDETEATHE